MLDLGFRAGVNQYLTRSIAVPDFDRASDVMSTAVVALSGLGIGLAVVSLGVAYTVPEIFDLPANTRHEAFWCILIVGFTASIQCILSPFSAVFVAVQRFDLSNIIGITARLSMAVGIYFALSSGFGLIGVSIATGCGTILDYSARYFVARRLVPQLELSRRRSSLNQLRDIGSFGLWNFLIEVSRYVYMHLQPLLIAIMLPISAVGYYALAAGLWQQVNGLFGPIGQVLYPAAAGMDVRGERDALRRLYSDGSRLLLLVVIPAVLVAFFWAEDFYRLWIGEKYIVGDEYSSVALLLQILLVGTVLSYSSNVAGQILLAGGFIRSLALVQISGAAINLTASLLLISNFQLIGVALASVFAVVAVDVIGIPILLARHVGMSVRSFIIASWSRLAIVSILLLLLFPAIREFGNIDGWRTLLIHGFVAGFTGLLVVFVFGLKPEERQYFRKLRTGK